MATLQRALEIAVDAYRGSSDRKVNGRVETELEKANSPYLLHPIRVMLAVEGVDARIAAVLHDVVEDCEEWSFERLADEGFSPEVVAAVDALTKRDGESYEDFVERARGNEIARRVKIADIEDNMDVRRVDVLTPKDLERLEKYRRAWGRLRHAGED